MPAVGLMFALSRLLTAPMSTERQLTTFADRRGGDRVRSLPDHGARTDTHSGDSELRARGRPASGPINANDLVLVLLAAPSSSQSSRTAATESHG
jgi:hypothetical protein